MAARLRLATQQPYVALTHLCAARRRIPNPSITNRHKSLICKILNGGRSVLESPCTSKKSILWASFHRSRAYIAARRKFAEECIDDRVRLRHYRPNSPVSRQGDLIILKRAIRDYHEKGVILVAYTPTFETLAATFDITQLVRDYRLVFEPSSYRNIEPSLLLFDRMGGPHGLQAAHPDDHGDALSLTTSLRPINLGSGDWMDPAIFRPKFDNERLFDVVMVASWSRLKRHRVLFRAIADLKKRQRYLKVAFIGYPGDLQLSDIRRLASRFGVSDLCHFYQGIPPQEVADIVASSGVAVHLSKAEGTNRASYEAWLCDTPLIVYRHCMGFRMDYVNDRTGLLADDHELADVIQYCLDQRQSFSPREWLLERSGYQKATLRLNNFLRTIALENGEPWTTDIVAKKNAPHLLYAREEDRLAMEPEYEELKRYLN